MELPYNRPRFIEIHEQSWCPAFIRQAVQNMLTHMWTHRIPPFEKLAPYEAVADILERVCDQVEEEDDISDEKRPLGIVDCCSGAGGPMPVIERRLNSRRMEQSRPPIEVSLSDLYPHTQAWEKQVGLSSTRSLSFLPYPVDATASPKGLSQKRHLRTFCLAFHHFGEKGARRAMEDAMRNAEGICIFELQEPDLSSLLAITMLFPFTMLFVPFQRPTWATLIFTYIIPIIPLILSLDGYVSAWRVRSFSHLVHLANLAAMSVNLEGEEVEWRWEHGRETLWTTGLGWPTGNMVWAVGRRDRRGSARGSVGGEST